MDVAGAARRTLGSGSARVWECRFSDPLPPPERSFTRFAEGVADLTTVRVQMRPTTPAVFDHLAQLLLERFPWLDDDDDDGNGDVEALTIYAGTAAFFGSGDHWMPLALQEGDPTAHTRRHDDPLWILEALSSVEEAEPRSGEREVVRGDPCRRLQFRIDAERIRGDVWIDDEQRIRRVTWRRAYMRRPRSPLKVPAFTSWRTVELWDFGIDVDIEIPTPMAPEPGPSLREMYDGIGALWRRKRAYDRRREDI
jgi:hypothetical protein